MLPHSSVATQILTNVPPLHSFIVPRFITSNPTFVSQLSDIVGLLQLNDCPQVIVISGATPRITGGVASNILIVAFLETALPHSSVAVKVTSVSLSHLLSKPMKLVVY